MPGRRSQPSLSFPNIAVEIQKCEFVFQNFHLRFFVAKKFFVPNLRTLLVYFLQLKKYGGVKNMTNMRYAIGETDQHQKNTKLFDFLPQIADG